MKSLPYSSAYPVIPGRKHGRALGFPTLNLDLEGYQLPLRTGVYAGVAMWDDQYFPAAIYYGPRPMIGDPELSLEVHVIGVDLAKPPRQVTVTFYTYLRAVAEFADEEALRTQIAADVATANDIWKKHHA